jgi:hypothetical protein
MNGKATAAEGGGGGGGGLSINGNQILKKPFTAYTPIAGNGWLRQIPAN